MQLPLLRLNLLICLISPHKGQDVRDLLLGIEATLANPRTKGGHVPYPCALVGHIFRPKGPSTTLFGTRFIDQTASFLQKETVFVGSLEVKVTIAAFTVTSGKDLGS